MTLVISRVYTYDSDVSAYITAVEAADGQPLEAAVCKAINAFVVGCKNDGIWNAIKASCILAGARTTNGALVPLKGTAPTPVNFDLVNNTDYNRKTGLVGNGSNKYLNTNRADNADPQNNYHFSAYATALPVTGNTYLAVRSASTYNNHLLSIGTRSRSTNAKIFGGTSLGFTALSRASSDAYIHRNNSASVTLNEASQAPVGDSITAFARVDSGVMNSPTNARLAFYSIGESLDLALLDARVTSLINAFAAAIP